MSLTDAARPRGRPPLPDDERLSERVNIRLDADTLDAVCRKALAEQRPVSEVIREAVRRDLGFTF